MQNEKNYWKKFNGKMLFIEMVQCKRLEESKHIIIIDNLFSNNPHYNIMSITNLYEPNIALSESNREGFALS